MRYSDKIIDKGFLASIVTYTENTLNTKDAVHNKIELWCIKHSVIPQKVKEMSTMIYKLKFNIETKKTFPFEGV